MHRICLGTGFGWVKIHYDMIKKNAKKIAKKLPKKLPKKKRTRQTKAKQGNNIPSDHKHHRRCSSSASAARTLGIVAMIINMDASSEDDRDDGSDHDGHEWGEGEEAFEGGGGFDHIHHDGAHPLFSPWGRRRRTRGGGGGLRST